jgi:putative membrane protein
MKKELYKDNKENLILRDDLAIDRTHLANERTILAYFRTSLTCFILGITLIKLFVSKSFNTLGFIFLAAGLFVLVLGFYRYFKIDKKLKKIKK